MRIHVETAIENDPVLLSRSLEAQMESLVIEPLEKTFLGRQERTVDLGEPKLVILDGLDECGEPSVQGYILKVISSAILRFPLRIHILVASRPEQEIRDSFNAKPLLSITTRLSLDDKYLPDDDIRLFLIDNFTALKESHVLGSLLPTTWPTTEDFDTLVQKSSGQFIYAATVVKFVNSPRRRPDAQLKIIFGIGGTGDTPFAELDALYLHIFSTVEDLPRVLEIMSCLYFLRSSFHYPGADDIEDLLFYDRGDVHLILSDLHSVLDVPDISSDRSLRVFHASLQDFLTDPNRSGTFFLDESIARARLAQCFIRHIRNFPTSVSETYSNSDRSAIDVVVSKEFIPNCLKASPTRDLLRDFLGFDFKHWASAIWCKKLAPGQKPRSEPDDFSEPEHEPWHEPLEVFEQLIILSAWFREQESIVKEYFGTEMSLYDHHFHKRDIAINMLLEEELRWYFNPNGSRAEARKHQIPAITHPLLVGGENRSMMLDVLRSRWTGMSVRMVYNPEHRLFPPVVDGDNDMPDMQTECIVEIQHFLRDPRRAGCYYVDSEMYAALSLWVVKVIFEPVSIFEIKYNKSELQQILRLAVDTLPFYLSNADHTSELADYLLSHTLDQGPLPKNYPNIQPLQDAIDLYLKVNEAPPPMPVIPQAKSNKKPSTKTSKAKGSMKLAAGEASTRRSTRKRKEPDTVQVAPAEVPRKKRPRWVYVDAFGNEVNEPGNPVDSTALPPPA